VSLSSDIRTEQDRRDTRENEKPKQKRVNNVVFSIFFRRFPHGLFRHFSSLRFDSFDCKERFFFTRQHRAMTMRTDFAFRASTLRRMRALFEKYFPERTAWLRPNPAKK
jgi:hypothetical protein